MKKISLTILFMLIGAVALLGQTRNVKGIVVDDDGAPVAWASVFAEGTTYGATTDESGRFAINLPQDIAQLTASFVGYSTATVDIPADGSDIRIMLRSEAQQMEQIVVTGMVQMDKRLFTGATDRLVAENMMLDGVADISRSLEGRSAGVTVQNVSGTFGSSPKIRIRGATSIYGDSKPLWVVDGVIMEDVVEVGADDLSSGDAVTVISSAIAGLNADDIESFQILKDGSATSIYGARAMAGVIVVTTKKARPGVTRIGYTGEYTMRFRPTYSQYNIMNSQEQMSVYDEMYQKGWLNLASTLRASQSGVYGKMYELMNSYDATTGTFLLPNTREGMDSYLRAAEKRNTNWFKELFNVNVMHTHSVSVSTGTEKAAVYASMSAMIDPGWTKQSSVNRYTANVNANFKLHEDISMNLIANASYRQQTAPGTLSSETELVYGSVSRDFDINPYSYALNTSRTLDPNVFYTRNYAPFNIKHELDNNYIDFDVMNVKFQGEIKWRIIRGLDLTVMGALKRDMSSQQHRITGSSNQALAYRAMDDATIRTNNSYLYTNPDDPYSLPISVLPQGGIYMRTDNAMTGYDFRASLNWAKVFNNKHVTNFYGGMELNSADRNRTWFEGWGLMYDSGDVPFYIYEYFKKSIEAGKDYYSLTTNRSRHAAFFGQAAYSYDGRYTLNGTIRYEGSNKLGKSRSARWLPTWNIAGAWNVHNEDFFKSLYPTISQLAMRASYSLTADRGPQNISNSLAILLSQNPYRPSSGVMENGIIIDELENSELTYEKKHEFNFGIDMGFLDDRISFSFDVYKRNNFDLIGPVTTEGVGGKVIKLANSAEMEAKGVDLSINSRNIITRDFIWTSDFIFAWSESKITNLLSNMRVGSLVMGNGFGKQGYPSQGLFSIPFAGLDEKGLPTFYGPDGQITTTGVDFQSYDTDYLVYEGPTDPKFSGGFNNNFRWKGFNLSIFLTYSFGNVVRLDPYFSNRYNDLSAMPKEFKNRWMLPGDENTTNIPVIVSNRDNYDISNLQRAYNAYNYSTERVAKGDFIRVKEISLTYDFPKEWLGKHFSNLSLKVQATNLWLLYADSKLNGRDPEFVNTGGVAIPMPRQITMSLRVGF